ncbi:hypothetical protein E2320_012670, partial [Naja naja]
ALNCFTSRKSCDFTSQFSQKVRISILWKQQPALCRISVRETGHYAMGELVRNLPSRQQRSSKNLEEDTIVAVLNTIHEIITDSSENARSLIQTQGIQKLVAISKSSSSAFDVCWLSSCLCVFPSPHLFKTSQSSREVKAASHVLQMTWSYKELRNTASATTKGSKSTSCKSGYDDSTLPLVDKSQGLFVLLSKGLIMTGS